MAAKKRQVRRGATPLVEKKPRREWNWRWQMPAWVKRVHWSWIVTPLVIAGLVTGGRQAVDHWVIQGVTVSGDLNIWAAEDIIAQVSWLNGQGFFSADLKGAYENVLSMPLIKDVRVKKRWPGYVEISITEDIPMAVWNGDQLIGISGDLMAIPDHLGVDKLALIKGNIEYMDQAVKDYRLVQQTLAETGVNVRTLSVTETGSVELDLSNNWHVALGRRNIDSRARRLQEIIGRLPAGQVTAVDLRYGKGAAIQWQSEQENG